MKISIVNTYASGGGAARAAYRLHTGLGHLGHESKMFVQHGQGDNVVRFDTEISLAGRVLRKARSIAITRSFSKYNKSRPSGVEFFSDDRSLYGAKVIDQIPPSDLVNLHWVANFVDYTSLPMLANTPVVWTLHDMNPFTGGCHYDGGCNKYLKSCGQCPQLGSETTDDLSAKIYRRKQSVFNRMNPEKFHLVSPSKWLAEEVSRSTLMKRFTVTVIPNGLDTDLFAPRSTKELKETFGISEDNKIVLFIADSIENRRKGLQFLLEALSSINNPSKVTLLSVGGGNTNILTSFKHIQIGSVQDERLLSMIYSLADVFVIPSVQDNLPNTVIESISCGTPVVGFNVGGIPDMVKDGETGLLAKLGDVAGLKAGIEEIITNTILREAMSENCRKLAVTEYSQLVQAKRYISLYESLIEI